LVRHICQKTDFKVARNWVMKGVEEFHEPY